MPQRESQDIANDPTRHDRVSEIVRSLAEHHNASKGIINLVPSESYFSAVARLPYLTDCYHRYFFNESRASDTWDFRGVQTLAHIETEIALPLLRKMGCAQFACLRPLSGLHLMTIALGAMADSGDTIFCTSPKLGGHGATAWNAKRLGLDVRHITGIDEFTPNLIALANELHTCQPRLFYIDQGHGLFPFDLSRLIETIRSNTSNCLIHVDSSHWMGLILSGALVNPLYEGADSFGGSTHKTFPGPHKAVFFTNRSDVWERYRLAQSFMISNHHFASVIAFAISLIDLQEAAALGYGESVISNAKALGRALEKEGFSVSGSGRGFTGGHQVWASAEPLKIDSICAGERLFAAGINVNTLRDLPGYDGPALRLGSAEATFLGFDESDMSELGVLIGRALRETDPHSVKKQVASLRKASQEKSRFIAATTSERVTALARSLIDDVFKF